MGVIEEKIRVSIRRSKIQKGILGTLAAVSFIALAGNSPSAVRMILKALWERKISGTYDGARKAVKHLLRKNFIEFHRMGKGKFLRLTQKGAQALTIIEGKQFQLPKPKRWDHKWRMLIFDIKEERRKVRAQIRQMLIAIGFKCLQKSVWVYPYDCEDLIILIKADLQIGRDVLYMVVDEIEYDKPLLEHFGLKK